MRLVEQNIKVQHPSPNLEVDIDVQDSDKNEAFTKSGTTLT
jgi:hypothetical protein